MQTQNFIYMKKILMTACGVAMMSIVTLAQQTDTTSNQNNAGGQQNPATQSSTNKNQIVQQDSTNQSDNQGARKRV